MWIFLTLLGLKTSALLKKRVETLEETVSFLVNLKLELVYRADNLLSLFKGLSELSACRDLDYVKKCADGILSGDVFSDVWKNAVYTSVLPFKNEERAKLASLGDFLGVSDKESQRELLLLYEEYFKAFLKKAAEENGKYSKICVMLGFVSGFGIFIMVI